MDEGAVLLQLKKRLQIPLQPGSATNMLGDTQQTALGSATSIHTDFKSGNPGLPGRNSEARGKKAKPEGSKNTERACTAWGNGLAWACWWSGSE